MKILFRSVWRYLFGKGLFQIKKVSDFPIHLKERTIYLVDDWAIGLKCPCGCQEDIKLNILPDISPTWNYKISIDKKINIYPSIRRISGCKSHFRIKNSKIIWDY